MIKTVLGSIAHSTNMLVRSWRLLIVLVVLYVGLLSSIYLFFASREASIGQLLFTFLLPILSVILLLLIQVIAARYIEENVDTRRLLVTACKGFWKLAVITLPVIILFGLVVYFLGMIDTQPEQAASAAPAPRSSSSSENPPLQWDSVAIATIQYLLLGLLMPLTLIHLWIEGARKGLRSSFRNIGRLTGRALLPGAVLTYLLGFVVFAVIPYFLVVTRTSTSNTTLEIGLFGVRLSLAVLMSLTGWVITVAALAYQTGGDSQKPTNVNGRSPGTSEDVEHVPAGP
jgi:hypothetical protein